MENNVAKTMGVYPITKLFSTTLRQGGIGLRRTQPIPRQTWQGDKTKRGVLSVRDRPHIGNLWCQIAS
jgi:hypothetical protein